MREWEIHSPQTLRFLGNLSVLGGQESLQNIDKLIKNIDCCCQYERREMVSLLEREHPVDANWALLAETDHQRDIT